jgi:hypothetical protein
MRCSNNGENEKTWLLGKTVLEFFLIAPLPQLRKPQLDFSVLRLQTVFDFTP